LIRLVGKGALETAAKVSDGVRLFHRTRAFVGVVARASKLGTQNVADVRQRDFEILQGSSIQV
jgi:hypothetical protein